MGFDEAEIRRIVRDGTSPTIKPTAQQIEEIAALTYDSEARAIMDRMLRRRLDPKAYVVVEVEHTLLMLRSCLCAASIEFIAYLDKRIEPLASQFYSLAQSSEMRGVHRVAGSLLGILRDPGALAKERRTYQLQTDRTKQRSRQGDRDKSTETLPITPPDTPSSLRSRDKASRVVQSTQEISLPPANTLHGGLPTPENSPTGPLPSLKPMIDTKLDQLEDIVRVATSNTPPAITLKQMEAVVDMTFHPAELRLVMEILDMRLAALKGQQAYHHLGKTLTLIHHCLFHASDEFLLLCQIRRNVFGNLKTSHLLNSDVRGRAEAVLDLLKDDKRLLRERKANKKLEDRHRVSAQSDQSFQTETSREFPASSSLVSLSRPRSLEDENALVEKIGDGPEGFGGYSDVWKGKLTMDRGATFTLVAVKVLRIGPTPGNDPERLRKRLEREVRVWQLLDHKSIADYHGVLYHSNKSPAIVSSWYVNGCADVYLRDHPKADPLKTIWEIVLGVEYLHQKGIVHGDLKAKNVMIDESGHAKLIDFGLSRLLGPTGPSGLTTSNVAFSIRWCAPELVMSDESQTTKASDVYAVASTALQLLTGEVPYATLKDVSVIVAVFKGETPGTSTSGFRYKLKHTDRVWALLDSCWKEAALRPTILEVKERLRRLYH